MPVPAKAWNSPKDTRAVVCRSGGRWRTASLSPMLGVARHVADWLRILGSDCIHAYIHASIHTSTKDEGGWQTWPMAAGRSDHSMAFHRHYAHVQERYVRLPGPGLHRTVARPWPDAQAGRLPTPTPGGRDKYSSSSSSSSSSSRHRLSISDWQRCTTTLSALLAHLLVTRCRAWATCPPLQTHPRQPSSASIRDLVLRC